MKFTVRGAVPDVLGVARIAGAGARQPPPPPPPPPELVSVIACLTGNTDVVVMVRSEPVMSAMIGVITWKRHTRVTEARSPRPLVLPSPSASVKTGAAGWPGA